MVIGITVSSLSVIQYDTFIYGRLLSTYSQHINRYEQTYEQTLRQIIMRLKDFGVQIKDRDGEVACAIEKITNEKIFPCYGREERLQQLNKFVAGRERGMLVITGREGIGKSTLLANWITASPIGVTVISHYADRRYPETCYPHQVYRNLLRQLGHTKHFGQFHETELADSFQQAVQEHISRHAEKLVIVIDGHETIDPMLQRRNFLPELPRGVLVLLSTRGHEFNQPSTVADWLVDSERMTLSGLDELSVFQLLKGALGQEKAVPTDTLSTLAVRLCEVTNGHPLVIQLIIAEWLQSGISLEEIRLFATLQGLFRHQLTQYDGLTEEGKRLLGILLAAKEPLDLLIICELTETDEEHTQQLLSHTPLCWWVTVATDDGLHPTISHPAIREALAHVLPEEVVEGSRLLAQWNMQWQVHQHPYSLRYYPYDVIALLNDKQRGETILALISEQDFLSVQAKAYTHFPDINYHTIHLLLKSMMRPYQIKTYSYPAILHMDLSKLIKQYRIDGTLLPINEALIDIWKNGGHDYLSGLITAVWFLRQRDYRGRVILDELLDEDLLKVDSRGGRFFVAYLAAQVVAYMPELFNVCSQMFSHAPATLLKFGQYLSNAGAYTEALQVVSMLERDSSLQIASYPEILKAAITFNQVRQFRSTDTHIPDAIETVSLDPIAQAYYSLTHRQLGHIELADMIWAQVLVSSPLPTREVLSRGFSGLHDESISRYAGMAYLAALGGWQEEAHRLVESLQQLCMPILKIAKMESEDEEITIDMTDYNLERISEPVYLPFARMYAQNGDIEIAISYFSRVPQFHSNNDYNVRNNYSAEVPAAQAEVGLFADAIIRYCADYVEIFDSEECERNGWEALGDYQEQEHTAEAASWDQRAPGGWI